MIITKSIDNFCFDKTSKTIGFADNDGLTPDQIEEDFAFEYATILNRFHDARSYCSECFGLTTDDGEHRFANHYLSCSFWDFIGRNTTPVSLISRPSPRTQIKD